jgi:hypothetical protein
VLLIKHRFGGALVVPQGACGAGAKREGLTALRGGEERSMEIEMKSGFRESVQYGPHPT